MPSLSPSTMMFCLKRRLFSAEVSFHLISQNQPSTMATPARDQHSRPEQPHSTRTQHVIKAPRVIVGGHHKMTPQWPRRGRRRSDLLTDWLQRLRLHHFPPLLFHLLLPRGDLLFRWGIASNSERHHSLGGTHEPKHPVLVQYWRTPRGAAAIGRPE